MTFPGWQTVPTTPTAGGSQFMTSEWWLCTGVPRGLRMDRAYCPTYVDHLFCGAMCFHKDAAK